MEISFARHNPIAVIKVMGRLLELVSTVSPLPSPKYMQHSFNPVKKFIHNFISKDWTLFFYQIKRLPSYMQYPSMSITLLDIFIGAENFVSGCSI
jgi:hypothetical protein